MKISCNTTEFRNKKKLREKLSNYIPAIMETAIYYREEDLFNLIRSALRANEGNILYIEKISEKRKKYIVDIERISDWIEKKVVPNTVTMGPEEVDLLKLMIFSLAMPYKMLKGETRATMTEKTRRTKARDFEQVFSDTFIGKIGEIAFRKFAKQKFNRNINLDWEISTDISTFKSDIIGSKKIVSIKSTDTLESIWAEAPKRAEYGIFVKVALPKDFFMKILAYISSLRKLLNFVRDRIKDSLTETDGIENLLNFIEETAYEEKMGINGYVCGFFETSKNSLKKKGKDIDFLGEVHEDKHLIEINRIKYSNNDWNEFFKRIL
jgi:hypothetical protein